MSSFCLARASFLAASICDFLGSELPVEAADEPDLTGSATLTT